MAQQRTFCIPITAQTGYFQHIKIKNAAEVILCASQLIFSTAGLHTDLKSMNVGC
jgi:hypothetical protein